MWREDAGLSGTDYFGEEPCRGRDTKNLEAA